MTIVIEFYQNQPQNYKSGKNFKDVAAHKKSAK